MHAPDVLEVLGAIERVGVDAWVEGGWGIDALVGRQTREHDDLDLAVSAAADGFERAVTVLAGLGYGATLDDLPVRLVVEGADGRTVDLHPIRFRPDGSAVQTGHAREYVYPADGFTIGRIGGVEVACLGARVQRDFHAHYEPRPVDHHDLAQLDALTEADRRGQ